MAAPEASPVPAPVASPVAAPVALPVAAPMAPASPVVPVQVAASSVAAAPQAPGPANHFGFLNYLSDRPQTPVYQPWQNPPSPAFPSRIPN